MHEILTSKEFYEKYKSSLVPGEFKFITKAFRQSDNTVAIFEKENKVDCYFQLPGYKTTKVPDNRKWIYKLPKGYINQNGHIEMDDGRYKIPVGDLEIWRNPYSEAPLVDECKPIVEEEKPKKERFMDQFNVDEEPKKESLLEKIQRLEMEIDEKVANLEYAIEKMSEMEEKILRTLSKFTDAN